ncbi:MAG: hypothetical protein NVS4B7_03040 [Ktedonobacteraceae bacterium]
MRRVFLFLLSGCVLLSFVLASSLPAQASTFSHASYTQLGSYTVLGAPTVSAVFIDQVLAEAHSPAAGKGQALYNEGVTYGIDPVYALAFFLHESYYGTTGVARYSLSLGNLRCIPNAICRDGYAWFPSWEAGFDAWYQLILFGYVRGAVTIPLVGHVCTTIEQIIPVYAPASDHNDVSAYIYAVESIVDQWRAGQTHLSGTPPLTSFAPITLPSTTSAPTTSPTTTAAIDPYKVMGYPTVSAAFIDQVLAAVHSPIAGQGQALHNDGIRYNIDPVYALAFFAQESALGTRNPASITLSLSMLRTPLTATCRCQNYHGLRQYRRWEDSSLDWYRLIRTQYVDHWHMTTLDQIMPTYAVAEGNAHTATFLANVKQLVDALRKGQLSALLTGDFLSSPHISIQKSKNSPFFTWFLKRFAAIKRDPSLRDAFDKGPL